MKKMDELKVDDPLSYYKILLRLTKKEKEDILKSLNRCVGFKRIKSYEKEKSNKEES